MNRHSAIIVSGGVHPDLSASTAASLCADLTKLELKRFSNGERYARFTESVRGRDLFLIQSISEANEYSINDAILETIIIIDAARRASAGSITVVLPFFPYSRQDRKALPREPISAAIIVRALEMAGANRIVSIDLHSPQIQAVATIPFDHLIAEPTIIDELQKLIKTPHNTSVVSPDAGRAKESEMYANTLGIDYVIIPKKREASVPHGITHPEQVEGVAGKNCIIIDDMIDTGGTILSAAKSLKKSGAKTVTVFATHGILSNNAADKFNVSVVDRLFVLDTVPQSKNKKIMKDKLSIIPSAPLIATAIRQISANAPLFDIFGGKNYK